MTPKSLAGVLSAVLVLAAQWPRAASTSETYTDVTAQMGISVPGLGSGAAWSDLDADGDLDLLVSTSSGMANYLYRNDGPVFANVTSGSGLTSEARNYAVGDYDNDGLDDIAIISFGYVETLLYHNTGGMLFDDISDTAPVYGTYSWRCSWVDYDDDGHLDLFLCGNTNYLFRNKGDGTFEEGAASAGILAGGRSCAWVDYDNDGLEDCYIGCNGSANLLYHNLGNGTFEEVGVAAGVNDPYGTSGVCAGDYDGDGYFDLYSVNISSPSNTLYHNLGNGTFEDVTAQAGVGDVGDGRTATFLDIDCDGLVDLFSSNHVNPNRLYRNIGNGAFADIAPALGLTDPPDPFGTAFGDYDGDGDIDVFLATHFGNSLLRCDGVTNHWIQVHLIGTQSNRDAIGAVARCICNGQSEYMRVDGGHGMGDTDSPVLGFGLGGSTGPFEIDVFWPSGLVEGYSGLTADTRVDLVEGSGVGIPGEGSPRSGGLAIIGVTPNPASVCCDLHLQAGESIGEALDVIMYDQSGRVVRLREVEPAGRACVVEVPVGDLASGVYVLRVSDGQESAATRLVVIR